MSGEPTHGPTGGHAGLGPDGHPRAAAAFVRDEARAHWHDQALWFVREKRDKAASRAQWTTAPRAVAFRSNSSR